MSSNSNSKNKIHGTLLTAKNLIKEVKITPENYENKFVKIIPPSGSRSGYFLPFSFSEQEKSSDKNFFIETERKVVFVHLNPTLYHTIVDVIGSILVYIKTYGKNFFLVIHSIDPPIQAIQYLEFFLGKEKIHYKILNMLDTQVFCKNPYNLSVSNAEGGSPLNYLRFEALKETVDRFFGSSVIPYKKVYLSRSRSGVRNFKYINQDSGEIESISDERIINEELLEEYLSSIGFEIINLEDKFDDYIEQMSFFRKVKVLLTPTSTGAMNILHMLPKTTLIEFSVPMVVGKFNQEFSEGIISITHHSAYPQLAFHSKANYIQISAGNSAEEIVKYLKNSNFLKLIVE